jgi:hypothetical protein
MLAMEKVEVSPQETMFTLISGFWVARSIYFAAKLGLADLLDDHPKTIAELARQAECEPRSLYRLMRALASVGIFTETSDQCFALTPLAATLQSGVPGSFRYSVMSQLGYDHSLGWSNGLHSLKTGEVGFDAAAGMSIWDHYAQHPEDADPFYRTMSDFGVVTAQAIVASYDFSQFNTVIDVGGAHGSLLSGILQAYPTVKGILFDRPEVIEKVQADRVPSGITTASGNFFESVPVGGDAYLMRWIIHDWNDEQCLTILKNCHQAMPQTGKLLLFESPIPSGNQPSPAKFMDLIMLCMTGGQERTEAEYRDLLRSAGFELTRVIPTPSMLSIIEAVKI